MSEWTKDHHGLKIPYRLHKRKHRYHPDILVRYHDGQLFLEEVKGKIWDMEQFIMKNLHTQLYCVPAGITFRVLYEKDLDVVK